MKIHLKLFRYLPHLLYLGGLGLLDTLEHGGGAPVGEDRVEDCVVDVVVEGGVHGGKLDADHQGVLARVGLNRMLQ